MAPRTPLALGGLALSPILASGCSCNDQGFTGLDWPDLEDDYGKWLSMDVAPDGDPVIAYYNTTMGALGFAIGDVRDDGTVRWKHEQVDGYPDEGGYDGGDVGQWASMRVAPDGTVWAAYHAGNGQGGGALRVAHRVDGQWEWVVADAGSGLQPNCGQWASLALDDQNRPVVAHHCADSGTLRIARTLDGTWVGEEVAAGTEWTGTDEQGNPITRTASVGMYADLFIAGDGSEHVAYYDAAWQNLNLLEGFPGAYTQSVVHQVDGSDVGHWPSYWTDGALAGISFEDRTNGDLLFARREGAGTWSTELVDSADYVGSDTELFRRNDDFAILYFDGRNNDMKLGQRDATNGWTLDTLGGSDAAVGFFNEVAETRGTYYVASYDYTNRHLFFRAL